MPPVGIGLSFAADVLRRYGQFVLVLRETVSSFTVASLAASEQRDDLRDGLLILCCELRSLRAGGITVRVEPGPGFASLAKDTSFISSGIHLEAGRSKNPNKNPVAEHAIGELGAELPSLNPEGGAVSEVPLVLAVANLTARVRHHGRSSRDVWTQRDRLTGEQLPIVDRDIILKQHESR